MASKRCNARGRLSAHEHEHDMTTLSTSTPEVNPRDLPVVCLDGDELHWPSVVELFGPAVGEVETGARDYRTGDLVTRMGVVLSEREVTFRCRSPWFFETDRQVEACAGRFETAYDFRLESTHRVFIDGGPWYVATYLAEG